MGKKAKGSRKGKKAWRANISTDDIEDYFEKETKDTLSGAKAIADAPSDSLFYVDKSTDIPAKRKIEKHREKILHYEEVLQRNAFVQPVPSSTLKKCKKRKTLKAKTESQITSKEEDNPVPSVLDVWAGKGDASAKAKKNSAISTIPAVEVDPLGCSFNPPFEAHQDSLAQAVAEEMQKVYQKELGPKPVPLTVSGEVLDEEEKYFLDADGGDEEDMDEEDLGHASDEVLRQIKSKRVTRVELNRRARRKGQLKAEIEAKKLKNINKEIDCLPNILEEIDNEDQERKKRHDRRVVAKQDRLKTCPPRLGKHKFEPAPLQVLLTEEISGSLRKLKGCSTLARDRFKSLEKRGLLVPGAKRKRKN